MLSFVKMASMKLWPSETNTVGISSMIIKRIGFFSEIGNGLVYGLLFNVWVNSAMDVLWFRFVSLSRFIISNCASMSQDQLRKY